jgi:hypothetical protein
MKLPGRLRATTLGDLFGSLYRDEVTGVLELIEIGGSCSGRSHRIHLGAGSVQRVEAQGRGLLDILLEQRALSGAALRDLATTVGRGAGRPRAPARDAVGAADARDAELARRLVARGTVPPNLVAAAVRTQMRERLEALFTIPDAEIRFRVACRPPLTEETVPLGPAEFLHGRARSRDRRPCSAGAAEHIRRRRPSTRDRALVTLGLDPHAGPDAVRDAFRALAARLHPDRFPTADEAERVRLIRRFAEISAAYHSLVA